MAKIPVVKEQVIERALVRRVAALGGICWKVALIGRRGLADRLVILPGPRYIFIELKRPRGSRLSMHQKKQIKILRTLDVVVEIVKTTEDIDALLR